jgi:hypothetical protein
MRIGRQSSCHELLNKTNSNAKESASIGKSLPIGQKRAPIVGEKRLLIRKDRSKMTQQKLGRQDLQRTRQNRKVTQTF